MKKKKMKKNKDNKVNIILTHGHALCGRSGVRIPDRGTLVGGGFHPKQATGKVFSTEYVIYWKF